MELDLLPDQEQLGQLSFSTFWILNLPEQEQARGLSESMAFTCSFKTASCDM